jgi:hypothetical protein
MDVADWLRALGLERYEAVFRENESPLTYSPISRPMTLTASELRPSAIGAGCWW